MGARETGQRTGEKERGGLMRPSACRAIYRARWTLGARNQRDSAYRRLHYAAALFLRTAESHALGRRSLTEFQSRSPRRSERAAFFGGAFK